MTCDNAGVNVNGPALPKQPGPGHQELPPVPAQQPNRDERRAEYEAYLVSPAWQEKRKVALGRAGHHCQLGANHAGPFDIHHNTYERFGGDELPEDLTVLCRACHDLFHNQQRSTAHRTRKPKKTGGPKKHPKAVKTEERTTVFDAMVSGREYLTRDLAALTGLTNQRAGSILASLRRSRIVTRCGKKWSLRNRTADQRERHGSARAELHAQLEREVEQRINAHITPIKDQVDAA